MEHDLEAPDFVGALNRSRDCSRLGSRGYFMAPSLSLPIRRRPFSVPPLRFGTSLRATQRPRDVSA